MRGTLTVRSVPQKGSSFFFSVSPRRAGSTFSTPLISRVSSGEYDERSLSLPSQATIESARPFLTEELRSLYVKAVKLGQVDVVESLAGKLQSCGQQNHLLGLAELGENLGQAARDFDVEAMQAWMAQCEKLFSSGEGEHESDRKS
jgi:hypothetical protein